MKTNVRNELKNFTAAGEFRLGIARAMQNTQNHHAIIDQRIKDTVRKSGKIHAADVMETNCIKQRFVR